MMQRIKQRGFTLIELLVVIAIIGILASVVLASLNNARDKGEDAAVRQQLSSMRAEAEISYDDNGRDYSNACTDAQPLWIDLQNGDCAASSTGYTAWADLNNGEYFCVDSRGAATTTPNDPDPGTNFCS